MSPTPKRQPPVTCKYCGTENEPFRMQCTGCQAPLHSKAVTPFTFPTTGQQIRIVQIDGEPWFVASDVCAVLDIAHSASSLRLLDDDEKGMHSVHTPGGDQQMTTVNEPGLYSLVLRSRKPEAKAFKRWITHDVLPTIRRTGTYSVIPMQPVYELPQSFAGALRALADETEAHDTTKAALAEARPAADAWTSLAEASGDHSVREAAQILDRDPQISTGQNRLFAHMREIGWIDGKGEPYQAQVDNGRLVRRTTSYTHPHTGEPVLAAQIRITPKGLAWLRRDLTGGQLSVIDGGAQ